MPKVLTEKKIKAQLRDIIEGKDKDAVIKGIKLFREIKAEETAKKMSQRSKVINRVVDDEKLQEMIGWSPKHPKRHEPQIKILECKADEIVMDAGRQGGKSVLCAYEIMRELLKDNVSICLIAPTYDLTDRVRHYLKVWIAKNFQGEMKVIDRPFPKIKTKWGSYLDCKSTEQPDQILGTGYDLIIVDECARILENIYHTYIVPASGTKIGRYFFISTPRGRNWFWRKWREAKEKNGAFKWTSLENPYFEKEKWELEKKRLPEMVFQQEYEALFLEEALVFRGLDRCLKTDLKFEDYNPKHLYLAGVDMGKYETFTAIAVMDLMTNRLVYYDQWKEPDWELIKKRLTSVIEKFGNCSSLIDATSITVGDAYVDQLVNEGFDARGYKLSGISKRQLLENLIVKIQNQAISIPILPETESLIEQLRSFGFSISPTGHIIYQAPTGMPDDGVIALALACWELEDNSLPELKEKQTEVLKFPLQTF